jgi:type II secretory pathway pseudopilin PulG
MHPGSSPRNVRRPVRRSGFTLLELIVTGALLLFGLLAITSTVLNARNLQQADHDRRLAEDAMRSTMESLRAFGNVSLGGGAWSSEVVSAFLPEGSPGNAFAVRGLAPVEGEAAVGSIEIVTDETAADPMGVDLGLPRDLNGDGDEEDEDVSADAALLPVVLRLRWASAGGERQLAHGFFLSSL